MVVHDLDFPAFGFSISAIHPEKIACEEPCLFSTGTGTDFDQDIFMVIRIFGQQKLFKIFLKLDFFLVQRIQFIPGKAFNLRITVFQQFGAVIHFL